MVTLLWRKYTTRMATKTVITKAVKMTANTIPARAPVSIPSSGTSVPMTGVEEVGEEGLPGPSLETTVLMVGEEEVGEEGVLIPPLEMSVLMAGEEEVGEDGLLGMPAKRRHISPIHFDQ